MSHSLRHYSSILDMKRIICIKCFLNVISLGVFYVSFIDMIQHCTVIDFDNTDIAWRKYDSSKNEAIGRNIWKVLYLFGILFLNNIISEKTSDSYLDLIGSDCKGAF